MVAVADIAKVGIPWRRGGSGCPVVGPTIDRLRIHRARQGRRVLEQPGQPPHPVAQPQQPRLSSAVRLKTGVAVVSLDTLGS